MRLVDLEFSEILELDPRISGGFGFTKNVNLDPGIDIDFESDFELYVDNNIEFVEDTDIENFGNFSGFYFPFGDDILLEDVRVELFVGDQIVKYPGSLVGGVSYDVQLRLSRRT